MMYMITITLGILVTVNFLLLKFSCNKNTKKEQSTKPLVLHKPESKLTTSPSQTQLAATGS